MPLLTLILPQTNINY